MAGHPWRDWDALFAERKDGGSDGARRQVVPDAAVMFPVPTIVHADRW